MSAAYKCDTMCRLCTLKSGVMMNIFEEEGVQRQILLKIKTCLPIVISKDDTLPKQICHCCAYKLDMFHEFRLRCLNSETMLKNCSANGDQNVLDQKNSKENRMNDLQRNEQQLTQSGEIHVKVESKMSNETQDPRSEFNVMKSTATNSEPTFVIPDDGMGYDDGVRVLRTLGTWPNEYTGPFSRIPFADHQLLENNSSVRKCPVVAKVGATSHVKTNGVACQTGEMNLPTLQSSSSNSGGGSNKSFVCPVCGKGLARKDKLVIHLRIHTGEKPYVCEVCNSAFARRDKLVIHMNKMKHRTPNNIAPLSKRPNLEKTGKKEDKEFASHVTQARPPTMNHVPNVSWSCEICGRTFSNREDWMNHAKGHLDASFQSQQSSSVLQTPNNPNSSYLAQQTYESPERHFCLVCRQDFGNKSDFMFHVRSHFDGKTPDMDLLARSCGGLMDASSLCS